jgi:hypothetical protein
MISGSPQKIENFTIRIEDKRIFIRLGYKASTKTISESVRSVVREERKNLSSLLHPVALYKILDYEETNKHTIFKGAEKVALCICTIGKALEKNSAMLIQKNEMLRGLVLDAFGSESAEDVARQADRVIAQEARKLGLWPSKRFSPGYGIWDIREQKYIFDTLPAKDIGVTLTESFMMVPRKSVSFRINFYQDKRLSTRSF